MPVTQLCPSQAGCLLPMLHQVHDLHLEHQPERYALLPADPQMCRHLEEWLSQPNIFSLVYEDEGALLGYAIYEIEQREATPFRRAEVRAMLHQICVDQDHRGRGIGTALIAEVRAHLVRKDGQVLAASYATFNTASARLMANAGLRPVMTFVEWRNSKI